MDAIEKDLEDFDVRNSVGLGKVEWFDDGAENSWRVIKA
jgi:hypothetical protein